MTVTPEKTEKLMRGAIRTSTLFTIVTSMLCVIGIWLLRPIMTIDQYLVFGIFTIFILGIGWMLYFMWYMWAHDNFI